MPPNAVAVLATPANFDPRKSWPVLVVCSTSDNKRQNRDDLVEFYRRIGIAEGWVLLAGDGPQPARNDTAAWRGAMTLAAVDALHRSFPGSDRWPIACAGFSGGGKGVGVVAPLLAKNGSRVVGIYITGANEDRLSEGYRRVAPGAEFSHDAGLHQRRPRRSDRDFGAAVQRGGFNQTHRIHATSHRHIPRWPRRQRCTNFHRVALVPATGEIDSLPNGFARTEDGRNSAPLENVADLPSSNTACVLGCARRGVRFSFTEACLRLASSRRAIAEISPAI